MDIGEHISKALEFEVAFTIKIAGHEIPVTETVVVTWISMAILIIAALLLTRNLKEIPKGPQVILEAIVDFLNSFSKTQFGHRWELYAPYIGTVFLFVLTMNTLPLFTPIGAFGFHPPLVIKPPTRDINVTAALAMVSIFIVLVSGLRARGIRGWLKHLAHPVPMMVPFNLLEYIIRPTALCLRLFGNILGGFIIMQLIECVAPLVVPPIVGIYFDILDGIIQATVFTFLTMVFIAEAIEE